MVAAFHLPEETFPLHFLFQRFQRLIDVVVAHHDLNDVPLSICMSGRAGNAEMEPTTPKRGAQLQPTR